MKTPLSALLWMDQCYAGPTTLADCLGDSYLCSQNPIYGGIRRAAVAQGVRFQSNGERLNRDYAIAPLLVLDRIISSNTVPYFPNAEIVTQFSSGENSVELTADDIRFLRNNYVMHESAHLLAEHSLASSDASGIVRTLLAESFANTVEALSNVYAVQPPHKTFLTLNCHMVFTESARKDLLRKLIDAFGFRRVVECSLWLFFFLNLQPKDVRPTDTYLAAASKAIFGGGATVGPHEELLLGAGLMTLSLNDSFREVTTPLHFRISRQEEDFLALRALDLDRNAIHTLRLEGAIRELADAAEGFVKATS